MILDACPLCSKIRDNKVDQRGAYCVALDLDGVKVVAIVRHDSAPTTAEAVEAHKMIGNSHGIIGGVDIPGHWAVTIQHSSWTPGRSSSHNDDPPVS